MESFGCKYLREQKPQTAKAKCVNDRLPLKDIFDMIAGTSTGGVIAAALSCPSTEFKNETYPVSEILSAFIEEAPKVYVS